MKTTLLMGLMLVLAVACGKKESNSSSGSAFRSGLGTGDGFVLVPLANGQPVPGSRPLIKAGGGTYQLQEMNQQVFDTVNAMYRGQIQYSKVDSQYAYFRVRVSGSLTPNIGNTGYSVGGYQPQPTQSNILYVQSIQPI
jgi:hypothetical protein